MPENIDARHRVVNILHESGVETLDPGHSRSTLSLATEQDEARPSEHLSRESTRDPRDHIQALLLRHRADDATDDGRWWPAPLSPPVARTLDQRRGNSRVNDFDFVSLNSRFHHGCLYRLRARNECVDAVPVL